MLRLKCIPDPMESHVELDNLSRPEYLKALPTLKQSHTADLKYESLWYRIWLSRLSPEDFGGSPPEGFPIIVEQYVNYAWVTIYGEG